MLTFAILLLLADNERTPGSANAVLQLMQAAGEDKMSIKKGLQACIQLHGDTEHLH
jgi:hypothetical protein